MAYGRNRPGVLKHRQPTSSVCCAKTQKTKEYYLEHGESLRTQKLILKKLFVKIWNSDSEWRLVDKFHP